MTLAEFKQGLLGIVLFGALWTLAELCRGQLLTGFPWGAGGYAHLQSALTAYPGQGLQVALNWYGEQLLANTEPLVVTPETAIPVLPQQLSPPYWQAIKNKYAPPAAQNQLPVAPQTALIGLPMGAPGVGYSNSALALGPEEVAYRYDKLHLVPFGE